MFEFHGWAVIDVYEQFEAAAMERCKEEALEFARVAVAEAQDGFSLFDVAEGGNGLAVLRIHGLRNHRRENAITLFRRIAAQLPASYGVLYIHDAEDSSYYDCFRVFRMARGRVEEFVDSILSPRIPTIEDGFPDDVY